MDTPFKLFFFFLSAALILALSLTGCTQNDYEKSTNQLTDSKQAKEKSIFNEGNDTPTENDSDAVVRFERERTFGSTDEIMMGVMGPIAIGPNSEVFITDNDQTTIHVFQPEGRYLTSLGSQGRGPGEFMGVTPNTTIAIDKNQLYITDQADTHLQFPYRMHEFSLEDLSFSRTIDLLASNKEEYKELERFYPKRIFPRDDGTFLVSYHRSANEYKDGKSSIYYVVQDRTGAITSGPVLKQKDRTHLIAEVTDAPIPYTAIHSFPFHGKSLMTVSGNNNLYAVHQTEKFKIDIYTPQGEYIRTIEHNFENLPFSKNELLEFYKKTNYGYRLGDGVVLMMISEAENLPETWPALDEMLIDDKNRLWISTIVEDFDIYEWWVLEESGELITTFEWPRDEPIEVVKNDYIYTRQTDDETGLQKVVRYRIEME